MLDLAFGSRFARKASPEGGDPLKTCSWEDAFTQEFPDDAHAWPYLFYQDGVQCEPQWRMPANLEGVEGTVLCNFLFFDLDDLSHEEALDGLAKLPEDHYLRSMCCLYFTKGGIRLVYRLAEPVLPDEYGPIVRGMSVELWSRTSLRVDPSTDQWHRCFRLPRVQRDDDKSKGPTWLEGYWKEPALDLENTVHPDTLPVRREKLPWAETRAAARADDTRPHDDDQIPEARKKLYRTLLRVSRFKDYIFEPYVQIQPGRRDATIMAMSGEVVARSYSGVPESGPAEIYLLLYPVVESMPPDAPDKLWRLIQHSWTEQAKKETDRKEKLAHDATQRDVIVEKMLTCLPQDEVPNDTAARADFARRHYCLQTGATVFPVRKDGTYSNQGIRASQLPAHFNDGLQCLVENGFRNQQGAPLGGQEILNSYSTNVNSVEFVPGKKPETKLARIGDRYTLQVTPFCLRQDLVDDAQLDNEIGDWLDAFEGAEKLKRWLASAVAPHLGGTAALYLHGPARVGKSMLAQGIADCFQAPVVPGMQAFSEFNGALQQSPVIMVDEGLPTRLTGMDISDLFRSLVTGGPISVMRKHQDALTSKIPYRVIFAANSFDMVRQLIGRRTMSPQDRDAFRERILVIDTGTGPADYLDRRGAMEFTKHSAKGSWIGGECRLARHIIRLHQIMFEENSFERSGRLLVEGEPHPSFTISFDLGGFGREVMDDLLSDSERIYTGRMNDPQLAMAMVFEDGVLWVSRRPYVKLKCKQNGHRDSNAYTTALDRFLLGKSRICPRTMGTQQAVDLTKLVYCAKNEGLAIHNIQPLLMKATGFK